MRKAVFVLTLTVTACEAKWWQSALAVAGATTLDFASSIGRQELIPLMRGPEGYFPLHARAAKGRGHRRFTTHTVVCETADPGMERQFEAANWIGAGVYSTIAIRLEN